MKRASPQSAEPLPDRIDKDVILPVERESGCTLVIVDMQPPFVAACKDADLVPAVVAQVKLAIERKWTIVLLEVKPWAYGQTVTPIMQLLEGKYDHYVHRSKEGDDGSALAISSFVVPGSSLSLSISCFTIAPILQSAENPVGVSPASVNALK